MDDSSLLFEGNTAAGRHQSRVTIADLGAKKSKDEELKNRTSINESSDEGSHNDSGLPSPDEPSFNYGNQDKSVLDATVVGTQPQFALSNTKIKHHYMMNSSGRGGCKVQPSAMHM